jgi:hypothetical protein
MARVFANTHQSAVRTGQTSTRNMINQAITHSMIKADDALKNEQYKDAHKFYKYALRLSEMQFGDQDSIVKNLRLLLGGIDEFLSQKTKKPQMAAEVGWQRITD